MVWRFGDFFFLFFRGFLFSGGGDGEGAADAAVEHGHGEYL